MNRHTAQASTTAIDNMATAKAPDRTPTTATTTAQRTTRTTTAATTMVVIVTYHPEAGTLDLIDACLRQTPHVVVIDNASQAGNILDAIAGKPAIRFKALNNNQGLAAAQNEGIRQAEAAGCERVLFFDQDTQLPEGFIAQMNQVFDQLIASGERVGILGPNYFDRNTREDAHYARLTPTGFEDIMLKEGETAEVSFIISSGSLMNVSLFKETGHFRDEFFIDQVDTEFCLRVASHGYKVFATAEAKIIHTIGNRSKHRLLFLTIKPNHHSALRKFFIFRNGVKTMMLYGERFPGFVKLMSFRLIHDLLAVLFYERQKWQKLRSIWRGITQGRKPTSQWTHDPR
ncbi:MAG: glycosyltransferase family 2 protein [Lautropia sp.]|nr:glycosyltransferase family 2 protein [Lautropia sp.]